MKQCKTGIEKRTSINNTVKAIKKDVESNKSLVFKANGQIAEAEQYNYEV